MPTLTYTPVNDTPPQLCFTFAFSNEHGDNDVSTYHSLTIHNEELVDGDIWRFMSQIQLVSDMIVANRTGENTLPEHFQDMWHYKSWSIPVERDVKSRSDNYYADLILESVHYYDYQGRLYLVEMKD